MNKKQNPIKDDNTQSTAGIQSDSRVVIVRKKEEFKYRMHNLNDISKYWCK